MSDSEEHDSENQKEKDQHNVNPEIQSDHDKLINLARKSGIDVALQFHAATSKLTDNPDDDTDPATRVNNLLKSSKFPYIGPVKPTFLTSTLKPNSHPIVSKTNQSAEGVVESEVKGKKKNKHVKKTPQIDSETPFTSAEELKELNKKPGSKSSSNILKPEDQRTNLGMINDMTGNNESEEEMEHDEKIILQSMILPEFVNSENLTTFHQFLIDYSDLLRSPEIQYPGLSVQIRDKRILLTEGRDLKPRIKRKATQTEVIITQKNNAEEKSQKDESADENTSPLATLTDLSETTTGMGLEEDNSVEPVDKDQTTANNSESSSINPITIPSISQNHQKDVDIPPQIPPNITNISKVNDNSNSSDNSDVRLILYDWKSLMINHQIFIKTCQNEERTLGVGVDGITLQDLDGTELITDLMSFVRFIYGRKNLSNYIELYHELSTLKILDKPP